MLELQNVSKIYKGKTALHHVSIKLEEGIYGLLGPNGAGKSTLMNIISQNIQPSKGQVLWKGKDTYSLGSDYRSMIGYAPQQQGLYESFTGRRFLAYMATLKAIPKTEMANEIDQALASVNLEAVADRKIGTYSGGMKQRLLIAHTIMGNPELIILDEPTVGLDPKERVSLGGKIHAMAKDKVILLSTHVLSDIESIAKEVIFLKSGHIALQGTVSALSNKYPDTNGLEDVYLQVQEDQADDQISLL